MTSSIREASPAIREGAMSPVTLVERCLARIDAHEDRARAWVYVDRDGALAAARQREAELQAGKWRGPLHGIPIGIKDIIDVAGFRTLAGSRILERTALPCPGDAPVVARLREAGAVILGKTVTTEYASFDPAPARNPWNPEHTPGGSSSGSAAAVALRMCLAAIGTQTGGSIIRPASYCGVVGLKPTYGRASLRGIVPVAFSLDHPGPIASSVFDAACVLQAIAGYDPDDPFCADEPVPDYLASAAGSDTPPVFGLVGSYFLEHADAPMQEAVTSSSQQWLDEGATIVEAPLPPSFEPVHRMHRIIMAVEAALYHRKQFEEHRGEYSPGIRGLIEEGLRCAAHEYAEARRHQARFRREILKSFHGVDVLVAPATDSAAPRDLTTTGHNEFQSPWSYCGLPAMGLPVALGSNGLPLAVQFIARPFDECRLLSVAAWCEKKLGFRACCPD